LRREAVTSEKKDSTKTKPPEEKKKMGFERKTRAPKRGEKIKKFENTRNETEKGITKSTPIEKERETEHKKSGADP